MQIVCFALIWKIIFELISIIVDVVLIGFNLLLSFSHEFDSINSCVQY